MTELAHDGDPAASDVMTLMGERLGLGVVSLVNIFNPEVVVVGGGAIAAGELLLAPAREVVAARALPYQQRRRAPRVGPLRCGVGDARRGVHGPRPGGRRRYERGRLIVCPTPIGNLEDVTLRVLSALREADVIACEDTRTTKVLLDRYGVSAERVRYDAHAERRVAPKLVERMRSGAVVALVSDAGMPLVSDPGLVLVQACMAAGLEVEVLPGPSAALAALVASGMEAATWRFVGFLPRKKGPLAEVFASPRWWSRSSRRAEWGRRWPCWRAWTPIARWPSAAS